MSWERSSEGSVAEDVDGGKGFAVVRGIEEEKSISNGAKGGIEGCEGGCIIVDQACRST